MDNLDGLTLPEEARWAKNVYWMYSILIENSFGIGRDEVMKNLKESGVDTRQFFVPVHEQPIYMKNYKKEKFPIAENLSRKGLNLPSGLTIKESEIKYITNVIKSM